MISMKYTKIQRLAIGRQIYDGEITCEQAAKKYKINYYTARDYMRTYQCANNFPQKVKTRFYNKSNATTSTHNKIANLQRYWCVDKEKLIQALILARTAEVQFKKRYEVAGECLAHSVRQQEYQIILKLSGEFPVNLLCKAMGIQRGSYYYWRKSLGKLDSKDEGIG